MSSNVKRDHHNLRRNLKTNGNAIEHNSTSAHDILKTNGMVVAEKNAAGQITFNPDEVTSGIKITGQTTFAKTSEEGHAIKVQASGTTDTGGRLALTGVYSSNDFKEQVNGIVDFAQTPVTAEAHGLATGGFIKNLTKGLGNQNATNAVTMGGILGIKGGTTTTVGAVSVVPLSVSGTWVNDSSGTIVSQTSVVNSSGGASDGTGAQLFIVTTGGVPRVSLVMNQAISPRIATNTVVFDRETHTIDLGSLVEYDWVTLGFVASHEFGNAYGRARRAGSVITISGTANNNGTYIIKSFDSTRRIATVENGLNADFSSEDWQYVSIPDFPLTDETLSSSGSTVATILGGGSGKNYGFRDVLTFTDPDAGSSSTLTVQVETGCGDYPSYTTFGTCGDDKFLASERMRITSDGNVGIGTKAPQNFFAVQPTLYNTGWAMQSADADPSANGRTLHGFGTTWTSDMVGKHFVFSNGYYAGKIETWSSPTKMVLSTATSSEVNVKRQAYNILHFGLQVTNTGLVIGEIVNTDSGDQDNLGNQASLQYQGVTGAGATITNIGSDINVNSNLTAAGGTLTINAGGTIQNTGIDLDIASGTSGTQSATGLDIGITGGSSSGANNIGLQITQVAGNHIKCLYDATNYMTLATGANGATTLTTVDASSGTDANLDLNVSGNTTLDSAVDISLEAARDISLGEFGSDGRTLYVNMDNFHIRTGNIKLKEHASAQADTDDYGQVWVRTVTPNQLWFTNDAGNDIQITSGAELAPHAGTILGYTTLGIDAADASYSLTTTMTVINDAMKVKFNAPSSGVVEISVSIYVDPFRRHITLGLSDQNTGDTYQAISFPNSQDVTNEHKVLAPPSSAQDMMINHKWVVTGLTSGTAYEWWLGAKSLLANGGSLRWGGNVTNEYGPFIMKATALPTAAADYAVYG